MPSARPDTGNKLLLSSREAAKQLSVCEKSIWNLAKRGELRPVRIGRAVRYDVADLRRFIEQSKSAPAEQADPRNP